MIKVRLNSVVLIFLLLSCTSVVVPEFINTFHSDFEIMEDTFSELKLQENSTGITVDKSCHNVICQIAFEDLENHEKFDATEMPLKHLCTAIMIRVKISDRGVDATFLKDENLLQQVKYIRQNFPAFEIILSLYDPDNSKVDFEDYMSDSSEQEVLLNSLSETMRFFNLTGLHLRLQNNLKKRSKGFIKYRKLSLRFLKVKCVANNWTFDVEIRHPFDSFMSNGYIKTIQGIARFINFGFKEDSSTYSPTLPIYGSKSLESLIRLLNEENVDKQQVLVNIPLYATAYAFNETDLFSARNEIGLVETATLLGYESSYKLYPEICSDFDNDDGNWTLYRDNEAHSMYMSDGRAWATLETPNAVTEKVKNLLEAGISGVSILDIHDDDYLGKNCGDKYPLLKSILHVISVHTNCTVTLSPEEIVLETIQENETVTSSLLLYILIPCVVVLLLVLGVYIICRHYKNSTESIFSNSELTAKKGNVHQENGSCLPKEFLELEIPTHEYQLYPDMLLGQGKFSIVLKGKILSDEVAVKIPKRNAIIKLDFQQQLNEIAILKELSDHQLIVGLLGISSKLIEKNYLYIFLEICPMGSLEKYLRLHRDKFVSYVVDDVLEIPGRNNRAESGSIVTSGSHGFNTKLLISWTHQICEGMEYIATKNIVHGDLAARNVLLASLDCLKICDFGYALKLYPLQEEIAIYKDRLQTDSLPWRSMAFETLETGLITMTSDVWAYGVTVWEIFSLGEVPYAGLEWNSDFTDKLKSGLKLSQPRYATSEMHKSFIVPCWCLNPKERPTFSIIKSELANCIHSFFSKGYEDVKCDP